MRVYFLTRRSADVFVRKSSNVGEKLFVVDKLTDGYYFGDIELVLNVPAMASVRMTSASKVFKIERKMLEYIFLKYPEIKEL